MLTQTDKDQEIRLTGTSKKSSFVGALLIVVALAAYILFLRPISERVDVLQANVEAKSVELKDIDGQIADFKGFESDLKLTTEVQRLEVLKAVPTEMNQDEVIQDIIKIAETYDIELSSISFSKGNTSKDAVKSLVVNASFLGNYLDLIDFLEGVEQNARVLKVNSINVQISKLDVSKLERASFSLSIETFFQN